MPHGSPNDLPYAGIAFPSLGERPYVVLNMVSTLDGKIVSGERTESVLDLGSTVDHAVMDRLEKANDMVLIGASTYRANPPTWNPHTEWRAVATSSGDLNFETAYFAKGSGAILSPTRPVHLPEQIQHVPFNIDQPEEALQALKKLGINRLLLMGGGEINAVFFHHHLVDEFFLTLAPKVKLGRETPTLGEGEPLSRSEILNYRLVEHHAIGDELFLRYART